MRRAAHDANKLKLEITETIKLKLEITETKVMEDEQHIIGVLGELSALGVRIALDDSGRGNSSLNYVKDHPGDGLKIDKSFIDGLGENPANYAIVRLIVGFAHTIRIKVTAEGVENERQAKSLVDMRCDLAQGFNFSKPLSGEAAGKLVATNPLWRVPG